MDGDYRTRRFVCPECSAVEFENYSDLQWHVAQSHTTYNASSPPLSAKQWAGTAIGRVPPQLDDYLRAL